MTFKKVIMSRKKRNTFNEINITPLTDIFLVLLIIMMVIAPMLDQQGLNLAVPDVVESTKMQNDSKILNVKVTNSDEILIEGELVSIESLENKLYSIAENYKDGMMIQTEENATHGTVVRIMDCARNSGISNISLSEV